jgi:6-phosphogluconolactonase
VLLGMGPDGHTCSLFPGHPVLDVREAPVAPVRGSPKPPPERVTLTLPVVRDARFTLLLTTGESKRDALAAALAGDQSIPLALLGGGLDEVACDRAAAPPT